MNEFLNPKSMLTPGVAGSLMMFLVNGIGCQFPELSMRYIALFISFLIGSVVWFSELEGRAPMVQKGIYWVLNSLVIFVVGFGTANLAADATAQSSMEAPHALHLLQPNAAYAAQTTAVTATSTTVTQAQLQAMAERLAQEKKENERLKQELKQTQPSPPPAPAPPPAQPTKLKLPFFKRW
nr:hypothetical protein [uncultured Desulfobulbus sp.]